MLLKDLTAKLVSKFKRGNKSSPSKQAKAQVESERFVNQADLKRYGNNIPASIIARLDYANLRKISFAYRNTEIILLPQVRELFGFETDQEIIEQIRAQKLIDKKSKDKKFRVTLDLPTLDELAEKYPEQAKELKAYYHNGGYRRLYAYKIPGIYYLATFLQSPIAKRLRTNMVYSYLREQEAKQSLLSLAKHKFLSLYKDPEEEATNSAIEAEQNLIPEDTLLHPKVLSPEQLRPLTEAFRKLELEVVNLKQNYQELEDQYHTDIQILQSKFATLLEYEHKRNRVLESYFGISRESTDNGEESISLVPVIPDIDNLIPPEVVAQDAYLANPEFDYSADQQEHSSKEESKEKAEGGKTSELVFPINDTVNQWIVNPLPSLVKESELATSDSMEINSLAIADVAPSLDSKLDYNIKPRGVDPADLAEFFKDRGITEILETAKNPAPTNSQAEKTTNNDQVTNNAVSTAVTAEQRNSAEQNLSLLKSLLNTAKKTIFIATPELDKRIFEIFKDVPKEIKIMINANRSDKCSKADYDAFVKSRGTGKKRVTLRKYTKNKKQGYFLVLDMNHKGHKIYCSSVPFTDKSKIFPNLTSLDNTKANNTFVHSFQSEKKVTWN